MLIWPKVGLLNLLRHQIILTELVVGMILVLESCGWLPSSSLQE